MRKIVIISILLLTMGGTFAQKADDFSADAKQGCKLAQCDLGNCYYYGKGVKKDFTQAAYWYQKAAEQGYAEAQFNLGALYFHGRGVTQDYVQAVYWHQKAAEIGRAHV